MKRTSPDNESTTKASQNMPGDLMDFIRKDPNIEWKHHVTDDDAILSYNLSFTAEKNQEARIKLMVSSHPLFDVQSMNGVFSVAHALNNVMLESHGKTIHGSDFIYITDKDNGFLFLDKVTKGYLHFGNEKPLKFAFKEKINSSVEISDTKDKNFVKAVLHLSIPGKFKYELLLDKSEAFRPFRSEVLCMVFACKDKVSKAGIDLNPISEVGIPVQGEAFYETSLGKFEKISSFKITNLSLEKNRSRLFNIPEGYKNLREINKNEDFFKNNFRQGPKVRLSEYRKNKKKPYPFYKPQSGQSSEIPTDERNWFTPDSVSRFQSGSFDFPTCFEETYGAQISNLIDEKILDDVKYFVNVVSKRLNQFSASNGTINIDWMNQIRTTTIPFGDGERSGLYTLLHDEMPIDNNHPKKLGLLDRLAVSVLSNLMAKNDNLANIGLSNILQNRVNLILGDPNIPSEERFENLTIEEQGLIIDAYIFNGIGTIKINYPSSFPSQSIIYDLLEVKLVDVDFDIVLANQAVVEKMVFENDGIHLVINIPNMSGKAWVLRSPSVKYFIIELGTCLMLQICLD
jgi:hypothetical protein